MVGRAVTVLSAVPVVPVVPAVPVVPVVPEASVVPVVPSVPVVPVGLLVVPCAGCCSVVGGVVVPVCGVVAACAKAGNAIWQAKTRLRATLSTRLSGLEIFFFNRGTS